MQGDEPQYTRKKVHEFLQHHTAYELIPESGKVVLLDVDLPVRQAFHALHEQGVCSVGLVAVGDVFCASYGRWCCCTWVCYGGTAFRAQRELGEHRSGGLVKIALFVLARSTLDLSWGADVA